MIDDNSMILDDISQLKNHKALRREKSLLTLGNEHNYSGERGYQRLVG